jgi:hypothetical protein
VPYIFIKRNKPIGSVILLHANAEDVFSIDSLAKDIAEELDVSKFHR